MKKKENFQLSATKFFILSVIVFFLSPIFSKDFNGPKNPLRVHAVLQNGHTDRVYSIAYSPNGQFIASGSSDETIKIWDAASGSLLMTLYGHEGPVEGIAFFGDSSRLVSSAMSSVKIWDTASGNLLKTIECHPGCPITLSPDGRYMATSSVLTNSKINIWDISSGSLIKSFYGHSNMIFSVVYSSDGRYIASASGDNTVKIWNSETGEVLKTFSTSSLWTICTHLAFSPDTRLIACGHQNQNLTIRNVTTGQLLKTLSGDHLFSDSKIAFTPNGKFLVSGGNDNIVKIWDVGTGKLLNPAKNDQAGNIIRCVACSPDNRFIASGSDDGMIKIWDIESFSNVKTMSGYSSQVKSVRFSPDGHSITFSGDDGAVKIWDTVKSILIKILKKEHRFIQSINYSPDGRYMVSGSYEGNLLIWDASSGALVTNIPAIRSIYTALYSPNGRFVAFNDGNIIKIFDVISKTFMKNILDASMNFVFSKDSRSIIYVTDALKICDIETGKLIGNFKVSGGAYSLALSPNKSDIVLAGRNSINLMNIDTGKLLKTLEIQSGIIYSVAYSPDGLFFVSGSMDQKVRVWDSVSGRLLKTLSGHKGKIYSVAYSPDGHFIVSGSSDTSVCIWNKKNEYISLYVSKKGDWFVQHANGRFDCSENSGEFIKFVSQDNMVYKAEQFKSGYFTPGLLAKFMRGEEIPEGKPVFDTIRKIFIAPGADDWLKAIEVNK